MTFVVVFIALWVVFGIGAAARLWRAGDNQPLVRARMRLMSTGALVLTLVMLVLGFTVAQASSALQLVVNGLAIVSALLFMAGFAPPRALRMWWRRRVTAQWQDMQLRLIVATTAREAAQAVTPTLANTLGGGAAVITADGELLADAGLSPADARVLADRIGAGETPAATDDIMAVDRFLLVIRRTAYSPLFGQDERDLEPPRVS